MKLLCVACDEAMALEEAPTAERGSMQVGFRCPSCGRKVGLLTNPAEAQLAQGLGYRIGGSQGRAEPLATARAFLERPPVLEEEPEPAWSQAAETRLSHAPVFVQPMVRRLYSDWARERGIQVITPRVMSQAKRSLGMEGM